MRNKKGCCGCTACLHVCPVKCITMQEDEEGFLYPVIDEEKCIGCTACARQCKFEAIEGEKKQPHKVNPEKCKGCHLCLAKCKKGAMSLVEEEVKVTN